MDVEGMENDFPECTLVTDVTQEKPKHRDDHRPRAHTPFGRDKSPNRSPQETSNRQEVKDTKTPPVGHGERMEKSETNNTDMDREMGASNAPISPKRTKKLKTDREPLSVRERTRSKTRYNSVT
jgi:hypothetical protein